MSYKYLRVYSLVNSSIYFLIIAFSDIWFCRLIFYPFSHFFSFPFFPFPFFPFSFYISKTIKNVSRSRIHNRVFIVLKFDASQLYFYIQHHSLAHVRNTLYTLCFKIILIILNVSFLPLKCHVSVVTEE